VSAIHNTDLVEKVRSASDILEVIGAALPLKKAGGRWVGLCPFHKEKSPSFNVNPQRQMFYCFGCHKGGDVFKFLQDYENIDFMEALKRLAERANIPMETFEPGGDQRRFVKQDLLQIHEDITRHWQSVLLKDPRAQIARDYLKKRGVSQEAVELFRLGCSVDSWDDVVIYAREKGFNTDLMEQSGLVVRKEGGQHFYDRFRGRLMFPICDEQGRVVGFSGRVLSGDEKTAKYVNSPETPIFTKGKIIFGLDKSKRAMVDAQFAVVCEGQLDLIACYMAGVKNVVAPQGTALTADHARVLRRYVPDVVLCFDADKAGQNATIRVLDELLLAGISIRVAEIPAPHDPDSYIRTEGVEKFKESIARARGFFDFYLDKLCQENPTNSDRGRVAIVNGMGIALAKTGQPVLVDVYAQKTAHRLGVSVESVRAQFAHKDMAPKASNSDVDAEIIVEQEPEKVRPGTQEAWLLKLLFLGDQDWNWVCGVLNPMWIQNDTVRRILEYCLQEISEGRKIDNARMMSAFSDTFTQNIIAEFMFLEKPVNDPQKQFRDLLLRLRNQFLDRQMAEVVQKLGEPGLSDEERNYYLQQQAELRQMKKIPLESDNSAGS
jgi:DNA primase